MYKIYINDNPLLLMSRDEFETQDTSGYFLATRYPGNSKLLLTYIDMLEKNKGHDGVAMYWEELEVLKSDFFRHFQLLEAAGGLVQNPVAEVLFIYRRGFWDLPKGKIDPGETREEAAVREVMEETGLREVRLGQSLPVTYHTYRQDHRRYLKITYWYRMYAEQSELVPEAKENIEKAEWHPVTGFFQRPRRMHRNIRDLLAYHQDLPDQPA